MDQEKIIHLSTTAPLKAGKTTTEKIKNPNDIILCGQIYTITDKEIPKKSDIPK